MHIILAHFLFSLILCFQSARNGTALHCLVLPVPSAYDVLHRYMGTTHQRETLSDHELQLCISHILSVTERKPKKFVALEKLSPEYC